MPRFAPYYIPRTRLPGLRPKILTMRLLLPASCSLAVLASACSPRIVGTWNVQKYETLIPGQQAISVNNVGTIEFNRNNTGNKDIRYNVIGIARENTGAFTWSYTKSYLTIKASDSEFAKIWLLVENKRNFQRLQATNGKNQIQTLELSRK